MNPTHGSYPRADEVRFGEVLLVEDDLGLSEALKMALHGLGIHFEHVTTIDDARRVFDPLTHEFILLDRTLPDGDGLEFCGELRESGYGGAILVLTARGEVRERVKGLTSGADDYLAKPFSWDELKARMIALARRYRAGPRPAESPLWRRDPGRLRILAPTGWVTLTPLEFKLATFLMDAEGAIVSREELLREVWGFQVLPRTRTVDHFLGRLRRHFEVDPERPRHFVTVRGAGYAFRH